MVRDDKEELNCGQPKIPEQRVFRRILSMASTGFSLHQEPFTAELSRNQGEVYGSGSFANTTMFILVEMVISPRSVPK